jgi:hypothetical protein
MAASNVPQFSTESLLYFADVLRRFKERDDAAKLARERLAVAFGECDVVTDDDIHAFAPVEASHAA